MKTKKKTDHLKIVTNLLNKDLLKKRKGLTSSRTFLRNAFIQEEDLTFGYSNDFILKLRYIHYNLDNKVCLRRVWNDKVTKYLDVHLLGLFLENKEVKEEVHEFEGEIKLYFVHLDRNEIHRIKTTIELLLFQDYELKNKFKETGTYKHILKIASSENTSEKELTRLLRVYRNNEIINAIYSNKNISRKDFLYIRRMIKAYGKYESINEKLDADIELQYYRETSKKFEEQDRAIYMIEEDLNNSSFKNLRVAC